MTYFTLLLSTGCILRSYYTGPRLLSFSLPRLLDLFVGPTKSENFASVDRSMSRSGCLPHFVSERFNSASGHFGLFLFLDFWAASLWYHLDDDFHYHVIGK